MPCHTRQLASVEFKATNMALLEAALREAGFTISLVNKNQIHFHRGEISGRYTTVIGQLQLAIRTGVNAGQVLNEIKRAHSVQNVRAGARQFGWQLTEKSDRNMTVRRRRL